MPSIRTSRQVEFIGCEILFSLPEWAGEDRFEYTQAHYFGPGHAWAGSYDRTTMHNRLDDALFAETGYSELCLDPQGLWVKYEIAITGDILGNMQRKRVELERVLAHWRDWQPDEGD